jgi:hypothetical protein
MPQDDNLILIKEYVANVTSVDICALIMGVGGLIIFLLLYEGNKAVVLNLIKEDGLVENLSAFFWLQASIICFYRIMLNSQKNKLLLWFWCIFCFLCFGEEISWGQRIFHYSIHSIQHISAQHEFNIHNLSVLSTPLGMSRFLVRGTKIHWLGLLNVQNLFYIGFTIYFLIIPLLMKSEKLQLLKEKINYHIPSFYFLVSVWPIIILSFVLSLYTPKLRAMIETREMFMAFVVLFYVSFYLDKDNSNVSSEDSRVENRGRVGY